MTREDALRRVKGYLTDYIPADNYEEVEEIVGALEQEPCEDAISRQAAIDTIESWLSCDDYNKAERHIMRAMQSVLYDLSSVTPQPKTGQWIDDKCSVCGKGIEDLIESSEWYRNESPKYCPFCGIKIAEVEDGNVGN